MVQRSRCSATSINDRARTLNAWPRDGDIAKARLLLCGDLSIRIVQTGRWRNVHFVVVLIGWALSYLLASRQVRRMT